MNTQIKLLLYIVFLLIPLCCDSLAYAENPMPSQFSDRSLLTAAKWTDMAFLESITGSWDKYTGTQDFEGEEILNTTKIQICGAIFDVQLRRFISDAAFAFVFVDKDDFSRDFWQQFLTYGHKTWGEPIKSIDYSWHGKDRSIDNHEIEWLLGNTHIRFSIFGAEIHNTWIPGICWLRITRQGK